MANGGQRFSLFPPLGSGTVSSSVVPSALLLVDMPTPGGGYTTQVATAQQVGAGYWSNGLSSQQAGMVSWNGTTLLTRRIVAGSNIVVNNGDGSANPSVALNTTLDFTSTTVTGGTFYNPLLVGVTFSGQSLSGGVWSNGTFSGVTQGGGWTLSGGTLSGVSISGENLTDALTVVGAVPGTLPNARRIAQGTNVTVTDNGAGNTLVFSVSSIGVTFVGTQSGLTGGPVTLSSAIGLAAVSGVAGSYTNASVTVDGFGRVTAASTGSPSASTDVLMVQVFS